jgi:hypothetical protein
LMQETGSVVFWTPRKDSTKRRHTPGVKTNKRLTPGPNAANPPCRFAERPLPPINVAGKICYLYNFVVDGIATASACISNFTVSSNCHIIGTKIV